MQLYRSGRGARARALAALVAMLALVAAACSSSGSGQSAATTTLPGPEPTSVRTVPLPAGVSPELPSFTPDGQHLVFDFTRPGTDGNQLATVALDGSGFTCVTCGLSGVDVGKAFPSRDGTKVLVRSPGGKGTPTTIYGYDIVECPKGILDCPDPTLVPVQLPGKAEGVLQTRELRLSPDGQHVAFSQARPGGWTLVLGTLTRAGDHYELTDLRLLNPKFQLGDAAADWGAAGAFYEVKGFADDGTSLVYASTRDGSLNYDDYLLDLATGATRRLTAEPDWDEPLDISPDGSTMVVGSSRGTHRIDALSQVTRPPFFDLVSYAQTARWLLTTDARDCIVRPWLLSTSVPDTAQPGQELDGSAWAEGYGPRAIPSWSPDGTRIVFWDELQDPSKAAADAPSARLRVVTLTDRTPGTPHPAKATPVPGWAWTYDQYPLTTRTAQQTVKGAAGGTATLAFDGNFVSGTYTVTYHGYTDDGRMILDGTESMKNTSIVSTASYDVDLTVSGDHTGSMKGSFTLDGKKLQGSVTSVLDGQQLSWPPAACPPPTTAGTTTATTG